MPLTNQIIRSTHSIKMEHMWLAEVEIGSMRMVWIPKQDVNILPTEDCLFSDSELYERLNKVETVC